MIFFQLCNMLVRLLEKDSCQRLKCKLTQTKSKLHLQRSKNCFFFCILQRGFQRLYQIIDVLTVLILNIFIDAHWMLHLIINK